MRCLSALLLLLTAACAGTAPLRTTTAVRYAAPEGVAASRVAVLPVIADPGLEPFRHVAADSLHRAARQAHPSSIVLSLEESLERLRTAGLVERYAEMVADYDRTGALDPELLREIGAALGVRHLLQMKVAYDEQGGIGAGVTSGAPGIVLYAHLWDTQTGERVWEAVGGTEAGGDGASGTDPRRIIAAAAAALASDLPLVPASLARGPAEAGTGTTASPGPWVASRTGDYYYWHECDTARFLPETDRIYFRTERQAAASGRAPSPIPQCRGPGDGRGS